MNPFDAVPAEELLKVEGGAFWDEVRLSHGELTKLQNQGQLLGAPGTTGIPSSAGSAIGAGSPGR